MKFLKLANLASHVAISQVHDMASRLFLQINTANPTLYLSSTSQLHISGYLRLVKPSSAEAHWNSKLHPHQIPPYRSDLLSPLLTSRADHPPRNPHILPITLPDTQHTHLTSPSQLPPPHSPHHPRHLPLPLFS